MNTIKFKTKDKISEAMPIYTGEVMPIYTEEEVKRLYDLSKTIIYSLSSMISSYELKNLSLEIAEFENWFNQNKKK
jgi:hypothetical protein